MVWAHWQRHTMIWENTEKQTNAAESMIGIARRESIHFAKSIEDGTLVGRQLLIANVKLDLKSAYKK